ncbi:MAG: hypothetical protein K6F88_07995 [Ruminococcus sp.]|nr:hypothetical protein [Ruminococcus sp.]
MSDRKFLFFIISIVLFGVSFVSLVSAMILNAVIFSTSFAPAVAAIISFVSAFAAIISACIYGKGDKQ